jgi:hypothetical protein
LLFKKAVPYTLQLSGLKYLSELGCTLKFLTMYTDL